MRYAYFTHQYPLRAIFGGSSAGASGIQPDQHDDGHLQPCLANDAEGSREQA